MKPIRKIPTLHIIPLLLAGLLISMPIFSGAADEENPPANEQTELIGGAADNGMTYHLRRPTGHNPDRTHPAIVILHGSNMNSLAYVNTMVAAWPDIASDYFLIGINGERRNKRARMIVPPTITPT